MIICEKMRYRNDINVIKTTAEHNSQDLPDHTFKRQIDSLLDPMLSLESNVMNV